MYERVIRGRPAQIHVDFNEEETGLATPTEATVEVLRADGTVLVEPRPADSAEGAFTSDLTAADTAVLDLLLVRWTSAEGQVLETVVEVAGAMLFSIAAARRPEWGLEVVDRGQLAAARTDAERDLEAACRRAFAPRYSREREPIQRGWVTVSWPHVARIRSVHVDGAALAAEAVEHIAFTGRSAWIGYGRQAIIGYEHGLDSPPPRAARAALTLARQRLTKGPIDSRELSQLVDIGAGVGVVNLATPGRGGSIFGLPEVDAFVHDYKMPIGLS